MRPNQVSEQVVTEQVTETQMGSVPMEPAALPEKKKSNGILTGLILCLVLAAGGIGFGVWAMLDGNSRVENLNKQISELNSTNSELLDQIGVDGDDTIINIDTDTDVDTEDYIYVGEWGIKIKKPENWRTLMAEYSYYNGYPQGTDSVEIRESEKPEGAAVIMRIGEEAPACEELTMGYSMCVEIEGAKYVVSELLVPSSEGGVSEEFIGFVTNPDNYSAI